MSEAPGTRGFSRSRVLGRGGALGMAGCVVAACVPAPPGTSAAMASGTGENLMCERDGMRNDTIALGEGAPAIAIAFACPGGAPPRSTIHVRHDDAWLLVHEGDFTRGSLLVGRGGKNNRYRVIDSTEGNADLTWHDGQLWLTRKGERTLLYRLPEG